MSWIDQLAERFRRPEPPQNALVLSGGGARAAYQAGVLQYIADHFPESDFPVITGVSAGAINAAHLANDDNPLASSVAHLVDCWSSIQTDDVFDAPSSFDFFWRTVRGRDVDIVPRYGLVDTAPLREYLRKILGATPEGQLDGITKNIADGKLRALALMTTNYATAQTVTWVQGAEIESWGRPNRVGVQSQLSIEHILASTSLPFLFPSIQLGDAWYGDGGIRLAEPLSPAIHLGANRLLAISTRYGRSQGEADSPMISGYPPVAQIFGVLLSAIFLDRLDQDAATLERFNRLLEEIPRRHWGTMRPIRFLMIRPSKDLGRLSSKYEADLSGVLKLFSRGMGSKETESPDWLSMILFEPDYTQELIDVGYHDAKAQRDSIDAFFQE